VFEKLHNGERDLAMRAGVALAVRTLIENHEPVHDWVLGYAAHELVGQPEGLLSSSSDRWAHYAHGVQQRLELEGGPGDSGWWNRLPLPVSGAANTVAGMVLDIAAALTAHVAA
jgi:DNA-binding transcriptional LysR family regulator